MPQERLDATLAESKKAIQDANKALFDTIVEIAPETRDGNYALDTAYDGLAGYVARFPVNHFVLFSRDDDRRWHWRTEFPLGG